MNLIKRRSLISSLQKHMGVPVVKIITGPRRAGKTSLLHLFKEKLIRDKTREEDIIMLPMFLYNEKPAKQLLSELRAQLETKDKCVLLIDEVQNLPDWQKIMLDLIEDYEVDIYVTTSVKPSKKTLSKLSGRYTTIYVHPLSFAEYLDFNNVDKISPDAKSYLTQYMMVGGFPIVAALHAEPEAAKQIAEGIYTSTVMSCISPFHVVSNQETFNRIFKYIIENLGTPFSVNKIASAMKQENRSVALETIYTYIDWLEEAYLIKRCQRFDLRTRTVLKTQSKFYLSDTSLLNTLYTSKEPTEAIVENVLLLELRRRGYETYIGKLGSHEISFYGIKRNDKIYIQVLGNDDASTKQTMALTKINDHYPKFIITTDPKKTGNVSGIPIIHLADFLLGNY